MIIQLIPKIQMYWTTIITIQKRKLKQKQLIIYDYTKNTTKNETYINYNGDYNNYNTNYYTENPTVIDNTTYSTPYITNVVDDNRVTYDKNQNKLKTNNLGYDQAKKVKKDEKKDNVIYIPSDKNVNLLVKNSNLTFGKSSTDPTELNNLLNDNIDINKYINNVNTGTQKYSNDMDNNTNSTNSQNNIKEIKRPLDKPQQRKYGDDKKPVDKDLIKNYYNNNYDVNNISNNDYQNSITDESNNNISLQIQNKIPKIDLSENDGEKERQEEKDEEQEEKKVTSKYKTINIENERRNHYNRKRNNLDNSFEKRDMYNYTQTSKYNDRSNKENSYDNNIDKERGNQRNKTPLRRPLDDYESALRSPNYRGFYKVRIRKRLPNNENELDSKKHIAYNKDSKLLDNGRKPEINVVKLSNNMSSGNIQYNNIIKRASSKIKNVDNSNPLGQMRKSDKKTKDNDNNQSNDNNFNNISEIKYDQNSTDNEKIKKHVLDDNDDEYLSSSKYNSNSKKNKHKTEDREDNLKVNKFDLNDSKNNEEKIDSNLKKNDLTDSEFKKMKNNDGLDEFDNNFNNHDLFYSKMRKIFDE